MYVVINEGVVVYIGQSLDESVAQIKGAKCSLHKVNNFDELQLVIGNGAKVEFEQKNVFSATFEKLMEKLNELGVNQDLAAKVLNNGEKLVGEAKSLGTRGMKAVGEGFVALGDLLRKAGIEEDKQ